MARERVVCPTDVLQYWRFDAVLGHSPGCQINNMQNNRTAALWALMLGNFVIGAGVLGPAGLLLPLSEAFQVDVPTVGTLIGYGAAVLCIEAPLLAFLTSKFDRRWLLTGSLALYAVGHFVSALAPSFEVLMSARLVMVASAAVFTPQAASAVSLFVPMERRAGAVAFIFLGWGLAATIAVPLTSLIAARMGWAASYFILAGLCVVAMAAVFFTLPKKLIAPTLSFAVWGKVLGSGRVWLVLAVTGLFIAGQFTEYPFITARLKDTLNAGPEMIAVLLAIYGFAGVVGAIVSARAIDRMGAGKTVSLCLCMVLTGLALWGSAGWLPFSPFVMAIAGLILWGSGGGPAISAQQARLIATDPTAASASVAMNSSILYAGQAMGTFIGAGMLSRGHSQWIGAVAVGLLALALLASQQVRSRYNV
jgi:DHA1 family inner membrane transport protein